MYFVDKCLGPNGYCSANVLFIGPDPTDKTRNGGIAKYMQYFFEVQFDAGFKIIKGFSDVKAITQLGLPKLGRLVAVFLLMTRILLSRKLNVVHINVTLSRYGFIRALPLIFCSRVRGVPVFLQIHGGRWSEIKGHNISKNIWTLIFKNTSKIGLFPGPQADELIDNDAARDKIVTLKNFVRPEKSVDHGTSPIVFVFLGRLVEEKGLLDVIAAFSKLRSECPGKSSLLILGSGPLLRYVRELASDDILAPGFLKGDDLESYLGASHVLVLPSRHPEGFPLSFLEAGARGIVPVITEGSAIPYFFSSNEEYIPIKNNDVEALCEAMKRLAFDDNLRVSMSARLRSHVESDYLITSSGIKNQFQDAYFSMIREVRL